MKSAVSRIIKKDMKNCQNLQNIYVEFDENNVMNANAIIIGPESSKYENSLLLFNIFFPTNYPYNPPKVEYVSMNNIRIHPNLYIDGKVCLSLLGTWPGPSWTSIMDLSSILLSIQSLLTDNPLRNEPGYESISGKVNDMYNEIIKYNSIDSLIIDSYLKLPESFYIFKNTIKNHIIKNNDNILKIIESSDQNIKEIRVSIYSIKTYINYLKLKDKYIDFYNKLLSST